jgi:hypothetical protein
MVASWALGLDVAWLDHIAAVTRGAVSFGVTSVGCGATLILRADDGPDIL